MKKLTVIAAMIAAFGLGGAAAFAASTDKPDNPGGGNDGQVCPEGDSGKIDVNSGPSVTVTAPDGKLIAGYCVKAGSANQGLGPEFVTVSPPQKTVTISHFSGKDVSHYSLTYVDEEQPTETTDTTPTETTPTETTPTETTPTETTPTETTPTTPTETTPTETTPTTPTETTPTQTTPTETTSTETTATETTPSETTVADSVEEEQQQQVFTPPTQQTKGAQSEPVSQVEASGSAARPTKAAQPAPFTP